MFRNSGSTHDQILLWGVPSSFWTGRTRSYLIKKGLDYQEVFPFYSRFQEEVIPKIGYFAVPITEMEDGTLIQDGTDTMEYLEERFPEQHMIPKTPLLRSVAWLIEFFGCEMFFIPGMHYRFNFPEQKDAIDTEFARGLTPSKDKKVQQEVIAPIQDFFNNFVPRMGINEQTIPAIEASHMESLALLQEHFSYNPYTLGAHPSFADFGLIGPFFGHLGRDPVPANIMKNAAPNMFRWTERMFESGVVDGEFYELEPKFSDADEVPETLIPFIEYLFRDLGPQVQGMLDTFNAWVEKYPDLPSGTVIQEDPDAPGGAHPSIGQYTFTMRGAEFTSEAFANVVYHFQRVLDVIDTLDDEGKARFDALMERTGGTSLMAAKLNRRIKSEYYGFQLA